ncbi:MAG: SurA N-terminal domain-containing protein [Ruminococcus sp.]|nr:SurA N-terminal domain-containing protein [Ruminococcus sp.]
MIKRFSAVLLALTITVGAFAGCSKDKDSSSSKSDSSASSSASSEIAGPTAEDDTETVPEPSLTIDGEAVDTTDFVMCTVDGFDVSFDQFRYYYYYTLATLSQTYGTTIEDIKNTENGLETFMDNVLTSIKQDYVSDKLAKENDITLDDEDYKVIDEQIETAKSNYESEEAYQQALKSSYLTEDLYRSMLERAQLYSKVYDTLFSNDGKYATSREDFKKLVQDTDEFCHEIHVMIPYYSQVELDDSSAEGYDDMTLSQKSSVKSAAYEALDDDGKASAKEAAKAVAEDVLKKANGGEDFEKLIEEYGWDIGLEDPSIGYYIEKNSTGGYPDELIEEGFKLKVDGISDKLVENSTYGYFIVKRLAPDMDYVEENIDDMIASYDQPAITKIFEEQMESMTVTYCDSWDKLDMDSIT